MKTQYLIVVIAVLALGFVASPSFAQATSANRYWATQSVIIHATGTAVTSDMSDYHFVKIHGRLLKVVPIGNAERIKNGSITCTGQTCTNQYGTEKAFAVMQFGTLPYKVVGTYSDSVFEGKIYTPDYGLRCLAGGSCNATEVGTLKYTVRQNYEGHGHAAIGEITFTAGQFSGKTYISVVGGIKRANEVAINDR